MESINTRGRRRLLDYVGATDGEQSNDETEINTQQTNNENVPNTQSTVDPAAKRVKTKIPRILDGQFFSIQSNVNGSIDARCLECSKIFKGNLSSTGNFRKHYERSHSNVMKRLNAYLNSRANEHPTKTQPTLKDFATVQPEMVCTKFIA